MNFKLDLEQYSFKEYKEFDISLIKFDQDVREMCKQNVCGQYGKNYMCPPAVKDIEEWKRDIASYKNAVMVTKTYQTKNSFDTRAWFEGGADFRKTLLKLKEDVGTRFPQKIFLLLGAGGCLICEKCSIVDNKPCRFPDKAFTSVEACGIDVMSLSKSAGVKYNNGVNTVTFMGVVLY
jgi:predicted metal-binding protein